MTPWCIKVQCYHYRYWDRVIPCLSTVCLLDKNFIDVTDVESKPYSSAVQTSFIVQTISNLRLRRRFSVTKFTQGHSNDQQLQLTWDLPWQLSHLSHVWTRLQVSVRCTSIAWNYKSANSSQRHVASGQMYMNLGIFLISVTDSSKNQIDSCVNTEKNIIMS